MKQALLVIALLKQDSRLTNKEIGQRVHRTGQAVGARIAQLMDHGERKLALMLS
jgi:Lrp/AsnC family leucine-responsive transcriptional regulator